MAKLPNADQAIVPSAKITHYLLIEVTQLKITLTPRPPLPLAAKWRKAVCRGMMHMSLQVIPPADYSTANAFRRWSPGDNPVSPQPQYGHLSGR